MSKVDWENENVELSSEAEAELERIRQGAGGKLRTADVVAFARDPNTALHKYFTWDDTEAAVAYRLWQARRVIRLVVVRVGPKKEPVRRYVNVVREETKERYYADIREAAKDPTEWASVCELTQNRIRVAQRAADDLAVVAGREGRIESRNWASVAIESLAVARSAVDRARVAS